MARPGPPGAGVIRPFTAPARWRTVDFVSDLHLGAALPETAAAWRDYVLGTTADAVFVLGDLFEIWVGDDARERPFEFETAAVIARAAASRSVFFMAGNRDFLLGAGMLEACGMQPLPDPTCLEAFGLRVVLTHGDAWCLGDAPYQAFRRMVRSEPWQRDFLARPLAERLAIAAGMRERSEERRRFDGDAGADVDAATALACLRECGAAVLIHGHTHRPGSAPIAGSDVVRHVLSDWDLDDRARPRAEVLRLTAQGVARLAVHEATAR